MVRFEKRCVLSLTVDELTMVQDALDILDPGSTEAEELRISLMQKVAAPPFEWTNGTCRS